MSGPHCENALCSGSDGCDCTCGGCSLDVLLRCVRNWQNRIENARIALDLSKDPEDVAVRAGQLQDLAQDMDRVRATMRERFFAS